MMSTAHRAGLMLFPVLLSLSSAHHHVASASHEPVSIGTVGEPLADGGAAIVVHTLAMLLAMSAIAILVYEKLGLAILRKAWVNLDGLCLWALAVIAAGVVTSSPEGGCPGQSLRQRWKVRPGR